MSKVKFARIKVKTLPKWFDKLARCRHGKKLMDYLLVCDIWQVFISGHQLETTRSALTRDKVGDLCWIPYPTAIENKLSKLILVSAGI